MAITATAESGVTQSGSDRWTKDNVTILAICILGWAFDI
jgi:hypothetical protein